MCKFFNLYEESLHLGVCKLAKYVRTALFSGKIYTSDKNFTRLPVAAFATNFKSGDKNVTSSHCNGSIYNRKHGLRNMI